MSTTTGTYRPPTREEATRASIINQICGPYLIRDRRQAFDLAGKARALGLNVYGPHCRDAAYGLTITNPKRKESDTTRARSTGTYVTLCEGDDLPWMLVCEAHHYCVEFQTKTEARAHRSEPEGWCEDCHDIRYASGWEEE